MVSLIENILWWVVFGSTAIFMSCFVALATMHYLEENRSKLLSPEGIAWGSAVIALIAVICIAFLKLFEVFL